MHELRLSLSMTFPGPLGRTAVQAGALCIAGAALACTQPAATCTSDSDGIVGGNYTFDLKVSDTAFMPILLKAQNLAQVRLTLHNAGTTAHDFVVDCLPTPNTNGCPTMSCFPDASTIAPVQPGESATASFVTPNPEGIYTFRSDVPGDSRTAPDGGETGLVGQFIVQ